jgi:hypothetical protein
MPATPKATSRAAKSVWALEVEFAPLVAGAGANDTGADAGAGFGSGSGSGSGVGSAVQVCPPVHVAWLYWASTGV